MSAQIATGGRFRDRTGHDLFQFVKGTGEMMFRVDNNGWTYTPMICFPDGTTQNTAASTTGTDIDAGTF